MVVNRTGEQLVGTDLLIAWFNYAIIEFSPITVFIELISKLANLYNLFDRMTITQHRTSFVETNYEWRNSLRKVNKSYHCLIICVFQHFQSQVNKDIYLYSFCSNSTTTVWTFKSRREGYPRHFVTNSRLTMLLKLLPFAFKSLSFCVLVFQLPLLTSGEDEGYKQMMIAVCKKEPPAVEKFFRKAYECGQNVSSAEEKNVVTECFKEVIGVDPPNSYDGRNELIC